MQDPKKENQSEKEIKESQTFHAVSFPLMFFLF